MSVQTGEQESAIEQLAALVEAGDAAAVATATASLHPADLAELFNILPRPELRRRVFATLDPRMAATVVARVSPATRGEILESLSVEQRQEDRRGAGLGRGRRSARIGPEGARAGGAGGAARGRSRRASSNS